MLFLQAFWSSPLGERYWTNTVDTTLWIQRCRYNTGTNLVQAAFGIPISTQDARCLQFEASPEIRLALRDPIRSLCNPRALRGAKCLRQTFDAPRGSCVRLKSRRRVRPFRPFGLSYLTSNKHFGYTTHDPQSELRPQALTPELHSAAFV